VYRLTPNGSQWTYTELYRFAGYKAGYSPNGVTVDAAGNLYGVLNQGGAYGFGLVYELSPTATMPWKFTDLHDFQGGADGNYPVGTLVFDGAGNLYGATRDINEGNGEVFQLSPQTGGGWTEHVIYTLPGSSSSTHPTSGLAIDASGNLFGATDGGSHGAIFELSPSNGTWTGTQLYEFTGGNDGGTPEATVTFDGAGNLFGTTITGGANSHGTVFELSPSSSGYTFSVIYSFSSTQGTSYTSVALDSAGDILGGNVYGSAQWGVIFKLSTSSGQWGYSTIHTFTGGKDGGFLTGLVPDGTGNFFGVAAYGGVAGCINQSGCGNVFRLSSTTPSK
jgi:uncharacterized repeat protein (TIGR03803 family)